MPRGDAGHRAGRSGERHPRARHTDRDVELMRQLHERGWGVAEIARKFDASKGYVSKVVHYAIRAV